MIALLVDALFVALGFFLGRAHVLLAARYRRNHWREYPGEWR